MASARWRGEGRSAAALHKGTERASLRRGRLSEDEGGTGGRQSSPENGQLRWRECQGLRQECVWSMMDSEEASAL